MSNWVSDGGCANGCRWAQDGAGAGARDWIGAVDVAITGELKDPDGGVLPKPIADEIVKYITEINWCRQIFRTIIMPKKTLDLPVITSGRSSVGQGVYYTPSQIDITTKAQVGPKLHSIRLTAKKFMAYANVDEDDIEDATVDIVDLLMTSFAEAFAEAEEDAMLLGGMGAPAADSPRAAFDGLLKKALDASLIIDKAITGGSDDEVAGIEAALSLAIKKLGKYGRDKSKLIPFIDSGLAEALRRSKRLVDLYKLIDVRKGVEGSVTSLYGVKVLESSYLDGAIAGKTGVAILVPKDEPVIGDRRRIKIKTRELIEHDKKRFVLSERIDFNVRHTAYNAGLSGLAEAVVAIRFTGSLS